jgi:hypothetical protein
MPAGIGPLVRNAVFDVIHLSTDPFLPPNPIKPGPDIHNAIKLVLNHDGLGDSTLLGVAPPDIG